MVESRIGASNQEDFARDAVIDQHSEVVRGMSGLVKEKLKLFSSPERVWQPSDLLPDFSKDGYKEDLQELRKQAKNLSPDLLVVIAGAYVTESALPTYQTWVNRIPAVRDETGTDNAPWAIGTRWWTADESRHPVVLIGLMNLSGRYNMKEVERTSQHLIRSGFNPNIGKDSYKAIFYVSIQEPGTQVSHSNTGQIAEDEGSEIVANSFKKLSGDEARHTVFYQPLMEEIFRIDPNDAIIAARDVLMAGINMPGMLMTHDGIVPSSGKPSPLYEQLSNASMRCGAYTPLDFMKIVKNLLDKCNIVKLSVSGDGAKAQEELGRMLRAYERAIERFTPKQTAPATNLIYSWLK